MNIAKVITRFAVLTGLKDKEILRLTPLIEDACDYIRSRLIVEADSKKNEGRIHMLAAVYALKLYGLCNEEGITSFTAGDVKITSSADGDNKGERLWREYSKRCADLIGTEEFLFGRVV